MTDELLSLKTWRKRRLMTVRALATAAGITASTVVRLESGRSTPQPRTIKAVSSALGIRPEQILEFRHAMSLPVGEELPNGT